MTNSTYLDRLRGAMAERRISQREAAERLGISQPSLSDRMNRRTPMSVDELLTLADMLGVAPADLLGDAA